ncbi:MAG: ATP-binding cassette domain-containing protein [Oligoflexus sp.]
MTSLTSYATSMTKMFRFLGRRTTTWLVLGFGGTLILASVELGIAYFLQFFLKALGILSVDTTNQLPYLDMEVSSVGLAIILVVLGLLRSIGQYLVGLSSAVTRDLTFSRLSRLLCYELLYSRNRTGSIISDSHHLNASIFQSAGISIFQIASASAMALQSIFLLGIMFTISWRESFIGMLGLMGIAVVVHIGNRAISRRAKKVPIASKKLVEGIQRVTRNWLLIRVLKTQILEHRKFLDQIESVLRNSVGAAAWSNAAAAGTPFLGIILLLLIVAISQTYWETPGLVLVSFLYLFIRFVQGLASTVRCVGLAHQYLPQFHEAAKFFFAFPQNERTKALSIHPEQTCQKSKIFNSMENLSPPLIEVCNLSFGFDDRKMFEGLNFQVQPGQCLGIVGPSGSGKSTLLMLLLGMLKPCSGHIKIAGQSSIITMNSPSLQLAYVGPEPFLLAGSIRENICYGLSKPSDVDIWNALKLVKLDEVIKQFSDQLDYHISEMGDGLSAGQKQRLCLARIFLGCANLVILDEATSNLDNETEEVVVEALNTLKTKATLIVVSHRVGALKHIDALLRLNDGVPRFEMKRYDQV